MKPIDNAKIYKDKTMKWHDVLISFLRNCVGLIMFELRCSVVKLVFTSML